MSPQPYVIEKWRLSIRGVPIDTPDDILANIILDGRIIVLTNWRYGHKGRNIYCFDSSGSLAWRIEESPYGPRPAAPYTGLRIDHQGRVIAGQMDGYDYEVDPRTGRIEYLGFSK